jgi:hypothetical protein
VIGLAILLVVITLLSTAALIMATFRLPPPFVPDRPTRRPDGIRLVTRVLFSRRAHDALTLDCTLIRVERGLPPDLDPPEGLPFTLRVRCPDTSWFAGRVEALLGEWAKENREVVVELTPENDKIRTMIASGESSVHLELSGAAGLDARTR